MPAGDYRLYADVVHANGFPETIVSSIRLPYISGRALAGDDAEGTTVALKYGGDAAQTNPAYKLPDGYTMVWKRPEALIAKSPYDFTFELLDPDGHPASDMALYMGMPGHAAFVKTDGSVFAHIHPSGTASMAALMIAQSQNGELQGAQPSSQTDVKTMPGMDMGQSSVSNVVGFPYGFPSAGTYRIFVQMKHDNMVETGVFDADVESSSEKAQ
jgi:hypothetical protein